MAAPIDSNRIGPNAVIQLRDVLAERLGPKAGQTLFEAAGHPGWWTAPPQQMVPEEGVRAVHRAVVQALPANKAAMLLAEAGQRTGAYILANRIPAAARWLLPRLPAWLAARLLVQAIARHAWTFCGSGAFRYRFRRALELAVIANPLAVTPGDPWHRAVFEALFHGLVSPDCRVVGPDMRKQGVDVSAFTILGPGFGL
jgi:divinyl protochlorophyllide a 8-vinyl-reductase